MTPSNTSPQEWQDIASAPKDGTNVLLIIGETIPDLPDIRVGCWCDQNEAMDVGYPDAGWLIWNTESDYFIQNPRPVSHWMPLPPAPEFSGLVPVGRG